MTPVLPLAEALPCVRHECVGFFDLQCKVTIEPPMECPKYFSNGREHLIVVRAEVSIRVMHEILVVLVGPAMLIRPDIRAQ